MPTDPATDTNTEIELTSSQSPSIKGVSDTFTLHGEGNILFNEAPIQNSTINFTVLGNGGENEVELGAVTNSKITVAIGTDSTATSPAGGNFVSIGNSGGTNTVGIGGTSNLVELNGDATNKVTFTSGSNEAEIGFEDDDLFGNKSTVTFSGTANELLGGDENFTVKGSTGSTTVEVGDGTNTIKTGGASNFVSVWGGNNNIDAGGGGSTVEILGLDGEFSPAFPIDPDGPDDPGVPVSPTDNVTIAGAGDQVFATYENVNVAGTGVTGATFVELGDGNNSVVLGDNALKNSAGDSEVIVGNGANSINVTGDGDNIFLGSGANGVTLSGDSENVNVTDPNGTGQDIVQLGSGAGSMAALTPVNLDHAGGSVTGTGLGLTTVDQAGKNAVTVSLGNGIGDITLGNGNDKVTANGDGTMITAGNEQHRHRKWRQRHDRPRQRQQHRQGQRRRRHDLPRQWQQQGYRKWRRGHVHVRFRQQQADRQLPFKVGRMNGRKAARKRSSAEGSGCAGSGPLRRHRLTGRVRPEAKS